MTLLKYSFIAVVILVVQQAARTEPFVDADFPPSTDAQRQGMLILQRFNETDERVDGSTYERDFDSDFEQICISLTMQCAEYIRKNRALVLQQMPDNPLFWQNYWASLEASVMIYPGADDQKPSPPEISRLSNLLEATAWWPMHELVKHGRIDVDKYVQWVRHIRRHSNDSNLLINKMVSLAMVFVADNALNYVMWESLQTVASAGFLQLQDLLMPMTVQERSMRRTMQGEFAYSLGVIRDEGMVAGDEFEDGISVAAYTADMKLLLSALADISERNWGAFWSEGVDVVGQSLVQQPLFSTLEDEVSVVGAYDNYILSVGEQWVYRHLLLALSDVYAGRVSAVSVARPDPPHWQWQWRSDPDEICLNPVSVHPSWKLAQEFCLPYYAEAH